MANESSKTVGFVLYEGCTLLDFVGATQVFAEWASGWNPIWLAPSKKPITTSEGLAVVPNYTFRDHPPVDIVLVPGGGGGAVQKTMFDKRYLGWLQDFAKRGKGKEWVGAVCVGTFIVAAAGLLENSTVTTHWLLRKELERLSKKYNLKVVPGFPRSHIDERTRRFTGGGVSASIDLALALVQRFTGNDTANAAGLIIQYEPELPKGIKPGSPTEADPKIINYVTKKAKPQFVNPIAKGVSRLLG